MFAQLFAQFLELSHLGTLVSELSAASLQIMGSLQMAGTLCVTGMLSLLSQEGSALLAQEAGGDGAGGGTSPMVFFLPYLMIGLLAYFLFVVPSRNKQQRFQQMLDSLKENDHVVTTGGIHGVVTNVNREQLKATLRVDEASGAKLKVSFWAIDSVESDAKEPSSNNKS